MDDNAEMLYILKRRSDSKKKKEGVKELSKIKRKILYEEAKQYEKKWEKENEVNKKAAKKYREKETETETETCSRYYAQTFRCYIKILIC